MSSSNKTKHEIIDSSSSSDEESMETSSELSSSDDESVQSPEPFTLSCLQSDIIGSHKKRFNSYLRNKNNFCTEKECSLKKSVVDDFTPWWESVGNSKETQKSIEDSKTESQLFDNWFDKSSTSGSYTSWLCGPKPKSSSSEDVTQVEDIEVPSIYSNLSQPKGRHALKKERREERNKTTGKKWYDMKLPDLDSKTKMDIEIIQMRRALDPKRFFKQNDREGLPKYFQLGTVVDEGTDFYSSRLTKKQRKQTLVEELMADDNVREYNKKKFAEIQKKKKPKNFSKKKKA